ncbi:MAG: cell division protein ZapA [Pseudomonadota bacterium]
MKKPPETKGGLVRVKILGAEYRIRSDNEETVHQIADYLNEEVEKIKANSPVLNRIDLTIMAAFKAASDLFQVREELSRLRARVESDSAALAAKIEENLAERKIALE